MNKTETIKIMAMLSAYYGQGKANAEAMANAWHLILQDYDYKLAEQAVINYAKNDRREYASFPSVGAIVNVIEQTEAEQKNLVNRVFNAVLNGVPYDDMPEEQKLLCDRGVYERGLTMDYEELLSKQDDFKSWIRKEQKRLQDTRKERA